jgi:hypothetical protein
MPITGPNSELIGELDRLRFEAEPAKEEIETQWSQNWDYYCGRQWQGFRFVPAWTAQEKTTINLVKASIGTILPIITDALPIWYVMAYDEATDNNAEALSKFLQAFFYAQRVGRAYGLAAKDGMVTGTGALKTFLTLTTSRGSMPTAPAAPNARVDVAYLDPYSIYPDPNAQNLEDCRYLLLRNIMGESMVRAQYPNANVDAMEAENVSDRHGEQYSETTNTGPEKRYNVWEVYDNFGHRLTIYSGNEILFRGPSPVPDGNFPVKLFLDDERGTDMWGHGILASGGKEIQDAINKAAWQMKCHARLTVNPRLVKKGIGNVKLDTSPGSVINLNNPNASLDPLIMAPLPPYMFSLMEMLMQLWDTMTGVHDVTQGQRPVGVQSGAAIMNLQEAAQTRIRAIIRDWSGQLGEVGQLAFDFMQRYYHGKQTLFVTGDQQPQRVQIQADEVMTDPYGEPIPYRVVVQPIQDLPLSQQARAEMMMSLAAIPWQSLPPALTKLIFDALRIPGRFSFYKAQDEAALAQVQQSRRMENEAGLTAANDMGMAGSPQPTQQDTSNLDMQAMAAAMGAQSQAPEQAPPQSVNPILQDG